jgi:hypothetical protein
MTYYYQIYKITNTHNQKYYFGAHKTLKKDDDYMGSGLAIRRAIKKYGKESFRKEVIMNSSSEEEMYLQEEKIIGILWKDDPKCYNSKPGGKGGFGHIKELGLNLGDRNPMHRPEVKAKQKSSLKETHLRNPEKYSNVGRKNILKALAVSQLNKGKSYEEIYGIEKAKKIKVAQRKGLIEQKRVYLSDPDRKRKFLDSISGIYKIISPNGEIFESNRLTNFCKERNFAFRSFWGSSQNDGKQITKGNAKGWKVYRLSQTQN